MSAELSNDSVELGEYKHYMLKEIFEQPQALPTPWKQYAQPVADTRPVRCRGGNLLAQIDSILILACGTSHNSGLVARNWLEKSQAIPCNVEIASEYRYRTSVATLNAGGDISQSGETADTLAALNHAKAIGHAQTLAICNVAESAIIRQSKLRFLTRAGPEIGVASTKAFTTQLAGLFLLTLVLAKLRGK